MCLFFVNFIDLSEKEEVTPLSKHWNTKECRNTSGSGDESDDNELLERKKEATTHKFQAIRSI